MWIYDSRSNVMTEVAPLTLSKMTGLTENSLYRLARKTKKIKSINCYVFLNKPSLNVRKELFQKEIIKGEVWKQYKKSNYEISSFGRVRKHFKHTSRLLMPYIQKRCMHLKLTLNGVIKNYRVRDLVAEVFLEVDPKKPYIIHKNGDFSDCSIWNLKRMSKSEVGKKTGGLARSKPVVLVDEKSFDVINAWPSARKAELDLYLSRQAITDRCNGKVNNRDFGWLMWEEDYEHQYGIDAVVGS